MLDPLPLRNPPAFQALARPLAERFHLKTLPNHIHELLFAFALYHSTMTVFSPVLSKLLFPTTYKNLDARTRLNWNIHVVALVQSVIICAMAFWVLANDRERAAMNWQERVYGYTGSLGMIQAFAAGYFVWDLYICIRHYSLFGFGMLAHAISGLTVYLLGFRPLVNYYAPVFVLYELSSPFLNIHWFCDKLNMTGGTIQMINGIILLLTFAGCRLFYGTYASYSICKDLFTALRQARSTPSFAPLALSPFALNATTLFNNPIEALEVVKYAALSPEIPAWIAAANILSNITLQILNWYWYSQMVSAIRKRFDPPFGTRRKLKSDGDVSVARSTEANGRKTVTIDAKETRRRPNTFARLQTGEMPPAPA